MIPDGHGYRTPAVSAQPEAVVGVLKTHDLPGTIHWLDAPGIVTKDLARLRGLAPMRRDFYFRTFVRGDTGRAEDSCDCYVGLRAGVTDVIGDAQASTVINPVDCSP